MNFIVKNESKQNITVLARKIGYYFLAENKVKEEMIFSRPAKGYPRFHLYIKTDGDNLIFNLHLDQRKPIYKGTVAHAGEYDSEIVRKEVERIKQILQK